MSAHANGSGPRSNRYSESRYTNWSEYEPWWLEIQAVYKRFDGRIAKQPDFPKVIELKLLEGFIRPCTAREVEVRLAHFPSDFLKGLRAVFILSGTTKQLKSWNSSKGSRIFYGHYWSSCVFLHAYPFERVDPIWLYRFYLNDVLIHEIGHHVDSWNDTRKDREKFAEEFVRKHG